MNGNTEKVYQINSPLSITYGWKRDGTPKVFPLNLNIYRNTNRFTLGDAKKAYHDLMSEPVKKLPKFNKIELEYVLYLGSNRKVDLMNICCIVDKFFCDVLTSNNIIIDDNHTVISNINFKFGGVDKFNPRIEIFIKEIS